MIVKLLVNYGLALLAISTLFYIFLFKIMPMVVRGYRKAAQAQKQYDREFDYINKDNK